MKALIFGISGQDGYFLSKLLHKQDIEVIGVSRSAGDITGDVSDMSFIEAIIKEHRPDYIFHLAANSTTQHYALFDNHGSISTATFNILESARLYSPDTRIFLSGSAMQFQNTGLPINEETEFEASSPYSVARIQSVYAGRYYRIKFGLKIYFGYFFNHDSHLRSEKHVNQKIAGAAKRIAAGSKEKLELGNINVRKEFNYAGDIVEAIWLLVNQDNIFEAVIGSGKAYSIAEWTESCFRKVNLDWRKSTVIQEGFKPEYELLVSDPRLIKSLGWEPAVDFDKLVNIMMNEL